MTTNPPKLWAFWGNPSAQYPMAYATPTEAETFRDGHVRESDGLICPEEWFTPVQAYVREDVAAADVVSAEDRGRRLGREDLRGPLARAVWGEEADEPDADHLRPDLATLVEQTAALRRERDALEALVTALDERIVTLRKTVDLYGDTPEIVNLPARLCQEIDDKAVNRMSSLRLAAQAAKGVG